MALTANSAWLDRIAYFKVSEHDSPTQKAFIAKVALKLHPRAYVAQERMPAGLLCIIRRGLVIKRWRFMAAGKVWGDDMILDNPDLIDHSEAVALTYVELFTLSRPDLDECCRQYPESGVKIRRAARRMMIKRLVLREMRRRAGLPLRSFIKEEIKELRQVTLEQKMDILIQTDPAASNAWARLVGKKVEPGDTESDVDSDADSADGGGGGANGDGANGDGGGGRAGAGGVGGGPYNCQTYTFWGSDTTVTIT